MVLFRKVRLGWLDHDPPFFAVDEQLPNAQAVFLTFDKAGLPYQLHFAQEGQREMARKGAVETVPELRLVRGIRVLDTVLFSFL